MKYIRHQVNIWFLKLFVGSKVRWTGVKLLWPDCRATSPQYLLDGHAGSLIKVKTQSAAVCCLKDGIAVNYIACNTESI